ncbi:nuclear transport factor 2 family protein [Chitinasiproducens palmae]|uniref:nuclear transport factor 2 family protein n=1 Tax=Chitinasiproducens palmae TaxID=1770053 RepID=UPI001F1BE033|nr:nuclear transport factor 2 family protein [Chitinasiproducens palmae]
MPTPTSAAGPGLDALAQTLHRFFHCLDGFDYAGLLACCTDDFRWLRQGRWLDGPDAVRAALALRPRTQRVAHLISNTFVNEADAGSAKARDGAPGATPRLPTEVATESYMTAYRADIGSADLGSSSAPARTVQPYRINRVRSRFRLHGDIWLLAEQQLSTEFEFVAALRPADDTPTPIGGTST